MALAAGNGIKADTWARVRNYGMSEDEAATWPPSRSRSESLDLGILRMSGGSGVEVLLEPVDGSCARLGEPGPVVDVEMWPIHHEQLVGLQDPIKCCGGEVRRNDLVTTGHDDQERLG